MPRARLLLPFLLFACLIRPLWADNALAGMTLTRLDGGRASLADFGGKPVIVNFWARWCPPCRDEMPLLVEARRRFGGQVEIVGIALEDDREGVAGFVKRHGVDYPILLGGDRGISALKALGNDRLGLPFTLAIDRHGKIAGKRLGRLSRADIDALAAAAR